MKTEVDTTSSANICAGEAMLSLSLSAAKPHVVRNSSCREDGCMQKAASLRVFVHTTAKVGVLSPLQRQLWVTGNRR